MGLFSLLSILIVAAGIFSFLNYRFIRLPPTIGVMLLALCVSLGLMLVGSEGSRIHQWAAALVGRIQFDEAVLHGMLAFLLFAGALHLDWGEMAQERAAIILLAVAGTLISTFAVGLLAYGVSALLGIGVPLRPCLLFGALISPTDPIAVLAIIQNVGAPPGLKIQMAGESLFNDGVGVVIFLTILELASGGRSPGVSDVALLLLRETGGGAVLGLAAGFGTYWLLRQVDEYQTEVLLTLGLAMGVYALADALHVSAPIAAVVSGLVIGNQGRAWAMSKHTREHVDTFWELVDGILNAVLFLLLGLEVLVMPFELRYALAGALIIPIVLLARLLSVSPLVAALSSRRACARGTIRVLTWGGLRGGISVALALSLPAGVHRNLLLAVTYIVVVFSILVQGLTVGRLIRRVCPLPRSATDHV